TAELDHAVERDHLLVGHPIVALAPACWPISAVLPPIWGGGACFGYAAVHFGVALPAYLLTLPRRSFVGPPATSNPTAPGLKLARPEIWLFAVLAGVVTIAAAILFHDGKPRAATSASTWHGDDRCRGHRCVDWPHLRSARALWRASRDI